MTIIEIALGVLLAGFVRFAIVVLVKALFKVVFKVDLIEYLKSKL